jgi:hypothetical protein
MAEVGRLRLNAGRAEDLLSGPEVKANLENRIKAMERACKAESSWGGYFSAVTLSGDRYVARLWSISSNLPGAHNRHQRMIRNLNAGA